MFARAACRLSQANKLSIVPKRNYNGVLYQFSPPKNKVPAGEVALFGVLITLGVFGPAMYLASNFQEYNGKAEARRNPTE